MKVNDKVGGNSGEGKGNGWCGEMKIRKRKIFDENETSWITIFFASILDIWISGVKLYLLIQCAITTVLTEVCSQDADLKSIDAIRYAVLSVCSDSSVLSIRFFLAISHVLVTVLGVHE